MAMPHPRTRGIGRAGRVLVVAAFASFLIANVIHNRFGLDSAIIPSAVFVALLFWRPRRWILYTAAAFIAVPSLLFLRLAAIANPADTLFFINHIFLLLAALAAVTGVLRASVGAGHGRAPEPFDPRSDS